MEEKDQEQISIRDKVDGLYCGVLYGYDVHGNGRHNKEWRGVITGTTISFNNLKEIREFCKQKNWEIVKPLKVSTP